MHTVDKVDNKQGFTLIEVMTVIAVISILTAVAVYSYAPARERASSRNAQTAMEQARGSAALCTFQNSNLTAPSAGARVCATTENTWPDIATLAPGWAYAGASELNVSDRAFSFRAQGPDGTITCNQTACTST
jgi:prepilin-type N-terminal cleavage/methylation domain-containing protein